MIRKFKLILTGILLTASLSLPLSLPIMASATSSTTVLCQGANGDIGSVTSTAGGSGVCDATADTSVNKTISLALNLFSAVVGIIAVIMIIVGGIKYVTSGGSSEKTSSAKDTILFAVVGLIVVALAQIIVKFVLNKASGL